MKKSKSKSGNKKLTLVKVGHRQEPEVISMAGKKEKKLEKELAGFVKHIVQLKKEKNRTQKKIEKTKSKLKAKLQPHTKKDQKAKLKKPSQHSKVIPFNPTKPKKNNKE